jgi:hypothetical protein
MDLPPGWKFTPLYKHCPKCGCDFSKEFVPTENDERDTKYVECDTSRLWVSRVAPDYSSRLVCGGIQNSGLEGVVRPLAQANKEATKRNDRGWNSRECVEHTSPGCQEHDNAHDHEDLVPVVEGKLRKWIVHLLGR